VSTGRQKKSNLFFNSTQVAMKKVKKKTSKKTEPSKFAVRARFVVLDEGVDESEDYGVFKTLVSARRKAMEIISNEALSDSEQEDDPGSGDDYGVKKATTTTTKKKRGKRKRSEQTPPAGWSNSRENAWMFDVQKIEMTDHPHLTLVWIDEEV
jgi:hypothetical protein